MADGDGERGPADPEPLAALAERLYRERRLRDGAFAAERDLFAEPAWDILLTLYAASRRGRRVSVAELGRAAAVAPSTGLRWIERLVARGMIERARDAQGLRLTPSSQATALLDAYLGDLLDG